MGQTMTDAGVLKIERYEIRDKVGTGGSARVYKAWDTVLDRFVAIKVLHDHLADDDSFRERFEREAKFVASFNHPNIMQIYDFSIVERDGYPVYYMVMPYIAGKSLRQVLEQALLTGQKLPFDLVLRLMEDLSAALTYAHNQGMTHRDVKPGNILLDERGAAILTDFGIARLVNSSRLTQEGVSTGTPTYMSPEQASGDPGDARSDLYGLGVILYEMLAGSPPFADDSGMAIMLKHINDAPPTLEGVMGINHPVLEAFIQKALAKNRADRFQSAAEFIAALRPILLDSALDQASEGRTLVLPTASQDRARLTPTPAPYRLSSNMNASQPPASAKPTTISFLHTLTQQALAHPQTSTGLLVLVIGIIVMLLVVVIINQQIVRDLVAAQPSITASAVATIRPELIPPVQASTGFFRSTFSERDTSRSNWPVGEFALFNRTFTEDGFYALTNSALQTARATIYETDARPSNISIAMEATLTPDSEVGSAVGIIFNYQDENNYNVFAVDASQRYSIWVLNAGTWRELRDADETWTPDDSINGIGESNLLSIDVVSGRFTGYINNSQVTRVMDDTFDGGQVGIYIATGDNPATALIDTYQTYSSVPSMTSP